MVRMSTLSSNLGDTGTVMKFRGRARDAAKSESIVQGSMKGSGHVGR